MYRVFIWKITSDTFSFKSKTKFLSLKVHDFQTEKLVRLWYRRMVRNYFRGELIQRFSTALFRVHESFYSFGTVSLEPNTVLQANQIYCLSVLSEKAICLLTSRVA